MNLILQFFLTFLSPENVMISELKVKWFDKKFIKFNG